MAILVDDSAYVLHLKCRFWTVERIYRTSAAEPGTLAAAYLDYLRTSEAAEVTRQFRYPPRTDQKVADLCSG